MPNFEKLTLPNEGEIITFNQGKPNVPNNPIVPFIRGDGTGVDIWPATQIVLDAAIKESQAYNRIKDKCIKTPITMETAKNAIRGFFDDEKAEMLKTRTVEKILEEGLIGGHLDSRKGTAWGLVSAMTQYTSHNRTKAADQTDERTFASQLDGSRNYMNRKFLEYLETSMLATV